MGREIHKVKIDGKIRYGVLSTVTMSYVTGFGSRKQTLEALVKEGYKKDVVGRMFKQATVVKHNKKQQTISVPVYRVNMKDLEKWRV